MSSNMLSDEEFQNIADWLFDVAKSRVNGCAHTVKVFLGYKPGTESFITLPDLEENVINVVRNMYNLNRLALVVRYSDPYIREDKTVFKPKFNPYLKEIEVLSTIKSLLYQCGEYIVMDTKQYKLIEEFLGDICTHIYFRGK